MTTAPRTGSAPAPLRAAGPLTQGPFTQRRVIDHGIVHAGGCPAR